MGAFTAPTGWTEQLTAANGTIVRGGLYWHTAAAGDPTSWSWALATATPAAASISAYVGVDPTNPVDVAASATNATSTNLDAPSVTTTAYGDLLLTIHAAAPTATIKPTRRQHRTHRSPQHRHHHSLDQARRHHPWRRRRHRHPHRHCRHRGRFSEYERRLKPKAIDDTEKYAFTGGGDTPDLTLDAAGTVIEKTYNLPGGATLTKRASGDVWSLPQPPRRHHRHRRCHRSETGRDEQLRPVRKSPGRTSGQLRKRLRQCLARVSTTRSRTRRRSGADHRDGCPPILTLTGTLPCLGSGQGRLRQRLRLRVWRPNQ